MTLITWWRLRAPPCLTKFKVGIFHILAEDVSDEDLKLEEFLELGTSEENTGPKFKFGLVS